MDHYAEAERLIGKSIDGDYEDYDSRVLLASQAQTLATLALVKAIKESSNG